MHNRHTFYYLFFWCVVVTMTCVVFSDAAFAGSYFNMTEKRSSDISPFYKWTRMVDRYDSQKKVSDDDCDKVKYHPCVILEWKAMLESIQGKSLKDQLRIVNNWANKYPYIANEVNWGPEDFWETPYEFMEVSGDCKDYAITKYYSLRALGVPAERMRLIVLADLNLGGIIHAVLGVYDDDDTLWILDNQIKQVVPALRIYHYRPIYGINEDNWWAYHPE